MTKMFKYRLQPGRTLLQVGDGTRFRSVGWQGEQLVVWAEVTEVDTIVDAVLQAVPTGEQVPERGHFIGTAMHPTMLAGSPMVVHVYLL